MWSYDSISRTDDVTSIKRPKLERPMLKGEGSESVTSAQPLPPSSVHGYQPSYIPPAPSLPAPALQPPEVAVNYHPSVSLAAPHGFGGANLHAGGVNSLHHQNMQAHSHFPGTLHRPFRSHIA